MASAVTLNVKTLAAASWRAKEVFGRSMVDFLLETSTEWTLEYKEALDFN